MTPEESDELVAWAGRVLDQADRRKSGLFVAHTLGAIQKLDERANKAWTSGLTMGFLGGAAITLGIFWLKGML